MGEVLGRRRSSAAVTATSVATNADARRRPAASAAVTTAGGASPCNSLLGQHAIGLLLLGSLAARASERLS